MSHAHPRRFVGDRPEFEEIEAVLRHWRKGLNTLEIALEHYKGDRSMEPRVAAIIAHRQDARYAARRRGIINA